MKNIFEKEKEKFLSFIKERKEIVAVYLFGSYSDGTYNENSDIDIAILYDGKYSLEKHLCDSVDVEMLFGCKVDYIDFNEISVYFRFKILKKGTAIYVKNQEILDEYIKRTQDNYIEMSYSRKKYEDYVLNHSSLEENDG